MHRSNSACSRLVHGAILFLLVVAALALPREAAGQGAVRCGDVNGSGGVDISDPVFLLVHLFAGGAEPSCGDAGLDAADAILMLDWLFAAAGGDALACAPL